VWEVRFSLPWGLVMSRARAATLLILLLCGAPVWTQTRICDGDTPKEVADSLWTAATRGELLTAEGRNKSSQAFFTNPTPPPGNGGVLIVSNYWGPPGGEVSENSANVSVGFEDLGQIDSALRYTPPKPRTALKTAMLYHFVLTPGYSVMYGSDGKTVKEKKPSGCSFWQIDGSLGAPWTTVNTAVRYVLETRAKTTDPVIRKNADETLAKLLQLH